MRAQVLLLTLLTFLLTSLGTPPAWGAAGGGGGGGGGGITNRYTFNGPFTVQNITNVFLDAVISNLALNPPITNILEGNKVYVRTNGSDSTGTRGRMDKPFLTPFAAKGAAIHGDTIMVGPGLYSSNNTNLLKGGVNWWFDEGATLSNRVQQAGADFWIGFFDDRFSGAVTSTIAGKGRFIWDMADYDVSGVDLRTLGPVVLTNALSQLAFEADYVESWDLGGSAVGTGGFYIFNCRSFIINLKEFNNPEFSENDGNSSPATCLYWERGDVYGRIGKIRTEGYACWGNAPIDGKGATNDLFLEGDFWQTTEQAAIYTSLSNSTHRAWFNIDLVKTTFGGFSTVSLYDGGRTYITALKIEAGSQQTAILVDANGGANAGGATAWVNAQKISSDRSWLINNNGTIWVDALEYEDTGSTATIKSFDLRGGFSNIRGIRAKSYANAVWHTGGTNYIDGLRIDSSAVAQDTNAPIALKANNLTLNSVSLLATSTVPTAINSIAAQTLTIQGPLAVNRTNAILDTDITLIGLEANVFSSITVPTVATNSIIGLDANGKMRAVPVSGTVSIAADGTLTGAAGTIDTTPFALLLRGTNTWADGSNGVRNVYTNVYHSPATESLTNLYWTNLADGQTLFTWVFPSNGVVVGFPQFASSDHIDGSTITPATNIWSVIGVTRRGTTTNILVQTATYSIDWTALGPSTNFPTRTITLSPPFQGGSQTLTNLSGTGAITNVWSKSLSNSTMVPLMRGPAGTLNPTNATGEFYGLEAGANTSLTPNGSNIVIASTASGGGTNFAGLVVTNQLIWFEGLFTGSNNIAEFGFQGNYNTRNIANSNLVCPVTYTLTNPTAGRTLEIYLIGQTNAATNHPITIATTGGATINWKNSTNGSFAFTLFSNSTAVLVFKSFVTATSTNIDATWSTDSAWPQRTQPLISAAGGSRSNVVVGGSYFQDFFQYTNVSATVTVFTNLATNNIDGHTLTNLYDWVYARWGGVFQNAAANTNNFQIVFGSQTILDTGAQTASNGAWHAECRIWRTGNTNQHVEAYFDWSGCAGVPFARTNVNLELTQTNGITTWLNLRGAARRVFAHTNNSFITHINHAAR